MGEYRTMGVSPESWGEYHGGVSPEPWGSIPRIMGGYLNHGGVSPESWGEYLGPWGSIPRIVGGIPSPPPNLGGPSYPLPFSQSMGE